MLIIVRVGLGFHWSPASGSTPGTHPSMRKPPVRAEDVRMISLNVTRTVERETDFALRRPPREERDGCGGFARLQAFRGGVSDHVSHPKCNVYLSEYPGIALAEAEVGGDVAFFLMRLHRTQVVTPRISMSSVLKRRDRSDRLSTRGDDQYHAQKEWLIRLAREHR